MPQKGERKTKDGKIAEFDGITWRLVGYEQPIEIETAVEDIDADAATQQIKAGPGVLDLPRGTTTGVGIAAGEALKAEPVRRGARKVASSVIGGGIERGAQLLPKVMGGPVGATVGARIGAAAFGTPFAGASVGAGAGTEAGRTGAGMFERIGRSVKEGLSTRPINKAATEVAEFAEYPYRRQAKALDTEARQAAKSFNSPNVAREIAKEGAEKSAKAARVGKAAHQRTTGVRKIADSVFGKAPNVGKKLLTSGAMGVAGKAMGPAGMALDLAGELKERLENNDTLGAMPQSMMERIVTEGRREESERNADQPDLQAELEGMDPEASFTGAGTAALMSGGPLMQMLGKAFSGAKTLMPRLMSGGKVVKELPAGPQQLRLPASRQPSLADAPSRQASMADEIGSRADEEFMRAQGPARSRLTPTPQITRTSPANADDLADVVKSGGMSQQDLDNWLLELVTRMRGGM